MVFTHSITLLLVSQKLYKSGMPVCNVTAVFVISVV